MSRKIIGYEAMVGDDFIPAEDALEYASERCGVTVDDDAPDAAEFKRDFVEWYFSSWITVYEGDRDG